MNELKEIKDHQALLMHQMGESLKENVQETFKAFQMSHDQKNVTGYNNYHHNQYGDASSCYFPSVPPMHIGMNAATNAPSALQHFQTQLNSIQNQIRGLTLTHHTFRQNI